VQPKQNKNEKTQTKQKEKKKKRKKEKKKKRKKEKKKPKKRKKMDLGGLARVLSNAMGVRFTESDIRRALGRQRVRGSNNFVVCVLPSDPSSVIERTNVEKSNVEKTHAVALRVALGETDDEEVEMERIFGQHAFERGFGLEPLFSGALQTPTRGLRSASCWPWGVCLHTLRETDCPHGPYGPYGPYGTAGAEIARALRRASETVLALDACAVRNHVRARGEWCLIDFDPYFTKVAETAAQRAAARGFVAVQMLLLGSQMPGLFTLDDIAEETERSEEGEEGEEERSETKRGEEGEEGEEERSDAKRSEEERREAKRSEEGEEAEAAEAKRSEEERSEEERNYDEGPQAKRHRKSTYEPSVPTEDEVPMSTEDREDREVSREELARELVARVVRVAASFPDAARALACVVQMYGAYGMVGVARKPARRAMADANKPDSVEALVGAGLCETHASLFVRAALGLVGPEEFEEVYAARIAGFFRSGPSGPSGPKA
jgi:hypothetical protein